jgi:hypothetical protein
MNTANQHEFLSFLINVDVLSLIRPVMECSHFFGVEFDAAIFIFSRLRNSFANLSVDLVSRALRIVESKIIIINNILFSK